MNSSKYDSIIGLSHSKFKRCIGLTKYVFDLMVVVAKDYNKKYKEKDGRPSKLMIEDQILMLLEYYRSGEPSGVSDIFSFRIKLWS